MKTTVKSELIAAELERKIVSGFYMDKLPSEQQVATQFAVARMTAAKALNLLVERGAAFRVPFRGTYVKSRIRKEIRICCNARFGAKLSEWCARYFPELTLKLVASRLEADLIALTTFGAFDYERELVPLPGAAAAGLEESGRLFPFLPDVHRRSGEVYAIPCFFSPVLLAYDRAAMRQIDPDFAPYELAWEKLMEWGKRFPLIRKAGGGEGWLHCLLAGNGGNLERAFTLLAELGRADEHGLFRQITRHGAVLALESGVRDFDVAPMPLFDGKRYAALASEALAVTRRARDRGRLIELALSTLEPEFIAMMTAGRCGIPADRALAAENVGGLPFRDDVFFSEIANVRLSNLPFAVRREIRLAFGGSKDLSQIRTAVIGAAESCRAEELRNAMLYQQGELYA